MNVQILRDFKKYLEDQGVTAPVFLYALPAQKPDEAVALRDYGDAQAPPWATDGRLQVLCRGPNQREDAAGSLAAQVHNVLFPATEKTTQVAAPLASGTVSLGLLSGPIPLGPDGQGRYMFSINYRVQLGRS